MGKKDVKKTAYQNKEASEIFSGRKYYLWYTLVFAVTALLVYIRFLINGKSFLWVSDGTDQHYTALAWFGQYLRDYLSGIVTRGDFTLPQWSFSLGVGDDILTTLHYYCIGDPLSLLAIFFDPEQTEWLYSFLILLRLYLSGIAFSEFVFYMKGTRGGLYVLIGAIVYCFCGFSVAGAMKHAFFFNPFLYLPIFLLGAEKILRKESARIFILITTIAALSNFYFFYMLTALTCIYCAVRFWGVYAKGERLKAFGSVFPKGVGSYLLGVGMSAVLFLPVILRFLNNPRYVDDAAKLKPFYSLKYMGRMLSSFSGAPLSAGYWNFLGFASIAFVGVIVLFTTQMKKHMQLKIFFILGVLMLSIPAAGYVLNGFAYMSNRWMFAFCMLIGYLCTEMVPVLLERAGTWKEGTTTERANVWRYLKNGLAPIFWPILGLLALIGLDIFCIVAGYRAEFYGVANIAILLVFVLVYRLYIAPKQNFTEKKKQMIFGGGILILTILSVSVNANYHYKGMIKQFAYAGTYYDSVMGSPLVELTDRVKATESAGTDGENAQGTGSDPFYRIDGYVLDTRRTADDMVTDRSMEAMMGVFMGERDISEEQENDDTLGDMYQVPDDPENAENNETGNNESGYGMVEDDKTGNPGSGNDTADTNFFTRFLAKCGLLIRGQEKAIRSYNTALLADYNGIMAYYSLMNPYVSRSVVSEDISTASYAFKIASFDSRMAMNALAGIKYIIRSDIYQEPLPYGCKEIASATGADGIVATLYENPYTLPLGFTYDQYVLESDPDIDGASGLRRQQLMLDSVFLETEPDVGKPGKTNAGLKKATLTPREDTDVILGEKTMEFWQRKDWVIYDTDVPAGSEVYLYIGNARFKGGSGYSVAAAATDNALRQCTLYGNSKRDYFGRNDILLNLGYYEEGLSELAFTMSEVGTLRYSSMILYYTPAEKTVEQIAARGREALTDVEITTNRITGTIEADADKLLFLSVPYSEGFTAVVNGEKTKVYPANGMYMALEIPEGKSEIVLQYTTPGLKAGAMISAVSICLYLGLEILFGKKRTKKRACVRNQ